MVVGQDAYMLNDLVSFLSFVGLVERVNASDKLFGGVSDICDAN